MHARLGLTLLFAVSLQAQTVGRRWPAWRPGELDIHFINTGRGDAALLIPPDGASLQVDAGDGGWGAPPRGVARKPDGSRSAAEWISRYVRRALAHDAEQITLLREPEKYPNFEVRGVAANGEIWTGVGTNTRERFPRLNDLAGEDRPSENMCSAGIRVSYGRFDFYTGGDIPGVLQPGWKPWMDIETPVAKAIGQPDVAAANHHGNRDAYRAVILEDGDESMRVQAVFRPFRSR